VQVYSFNRRVENLFNSYFLHYENIAIKLDEHQISISLLDEHNEDPATLELIKFVDHHQITFWDGYSQSEIIEASNDKDSAKLMKRFMKKLLKILKR
jgi:hypothetical protein